MKKAIILGLAALLTYSCTFDPVPKPDEETVKQSVSYWTFATQGVPKSGSRVQYLDANEDGRIDGLEYSQNIDGSGSRRLLMYDTTQIEYYKKHFENLDRALIMTPSLDSAVNQFIDAAKELKWKYELERYNQQKHPI